MIRAEHKMQVLDENCREINRQTDFNKMTLYEYTRTEAENDPRFFSWLFDDGEIDDFGINMTDAQKEEYEEFVNSL